MKKQQGVNMKKTLKVALFTVTSGIFLQAFPLFGQTSTEKLMKLPAPERSDAY